VTFNANLGSEFSPIEIEHAYGFIYLSPLTNCFKIMNNILLMFKKYKDEYPDLIEF
jgi:hypothetical protein